MKTFKIKDLVISMEGPQKTTVITMKLRTLCLPCTKVVSKISPVIACLTGSNPVTFCRPTPIYQCKYTPLDNWCGGTPSVCGGASPEPWEFDIDEIVILEDIRQIRIEAVELEKAYEALLTPQTAEDIGQVESKLNEAIAFVRSLKK
ncbi:MAG: hypothetical protein JNK77_14255 [Saprospiraceae bacterium]|nr:hypothetical protein [Saprospiraceae bacterium]